MKLPRIFYLRHKDWRTDEAILATHIDDLFVGFPTPSGMQYVLLREAGQTGWKYSDDRVRWHDFPKARSNRK